MTPTLAQPSGRPLATADPRLLVRAAAKALRPPPRLRLSTWIERHLVLPAGVSSTPGHVRLWPYQREIADAIGDPLLERVTVVKPVRVGYSMTLTGATAAYVANDPAPILFLLPTEADCRDLVVSDLEPTFAATPAVAGALKDDTGGEDRNTMLSRRYPGGSLKVVAAKAPRNLRRHNTRVLLIDEADAMAMTPEGSPILLAEKRTMSFGDRKIVLGSTPLDADTSHVLRSYAQSDQRIFEVPCPMCGTFTEILWGHIDWPGGDPTAARFKCPACQALVTEAHKPAMVTAGRWRATQPAVRGHAGFRLNALVSLLPNASWGNLAVEFLRAKGDTDELRTFVNTILAQGWTGTADLDDAALAQRREPFSLDAIPGEVLVLTAGADIQHDRVEVVICGWSPSGSATGDPWVLGHVVLFGAFREASTQMELDQLTRATWAHPLGGRIGLEAMIVDSGDGSHTDAIYEFCFPRFSRRVWAGKGLAGRRPSFALSDSKIRTKAGVAGKLVLVGVDTIKTGLFDRLERAVATMHFAETLTDEWFAQLASERKAVRYHRGQPIVWFERIKGRKAEALDGYCYAAAARAGVTVNWQQKAQALRVAPVAPSARPEAPPRVHQSSWVTRTMRR